MSMNTPWHIDGYRQPAPRRTLAEEMGDLNVSTDNITYDNNQRIYNIFKKNQCCDGIKSFIEGSIDYHYLFVNDAQTHYFLSDEKLNLNNVTVTPLIRYKNSYLFSIKHNDVFYFFKVDGKSTDIHNYTDNRYITMIESVPILYMFNFNTLKNETLNCIYSRDKELYAFKIVADNLYEQVLIEVVGQGSFLYITYDGGIYPFNTEEMVNYHFKPKQLSKKSLKKQKKSPKKQKKSPTPNKQKKSPKKQKKSPTPKKKSPTQRSKR